LTLTTPRTENRPSTKTNKKWAVKRITVNLARTEVIKLEKYCLQTGRAATDVIRELIRSLSKTNS
jgi:hypothetical protein